MQRVIEALPYLRRAVATLLAALIAAAPAAAQSAAQTPATAAIELSVAESARALLAQALRAGRLGAARVDVQIGALDPRLTLAPCRRIEPYLPAGQKPLGRTRVGLRCADGAVRWDVSLPVTVSVFAPAIVARQALPAGTLLSDEHLVQAEIDWGAPEAQRAQADVRTLVGRELARPLASGAPVQTSDLRMRQWFAAGETVQLTARGAGFAISTEGLAMNPGFEGQPVRVRTANGRVVSGRASGERFVEVSL